MSRAHIFGFDTNPAQFARMGNPWVTKREQQELGNSPNNRKEVRANRRPRPCDLPYPEIERIARQLTPEEEQARRVRANLQLIRNLSRQARGQEVRETTGFKPKLPIVSTIRPAREAELTVEQRAKREIQRAEVALRCDHATREDERARLKAVIAAAKARLEHLG